MAEQGPFQPTLDDLISTQHGFPTSNMVRQGYAMGADPMPKPGLKGDMDMASLPWWMMPFAALAGMRGMRPNVAGAQMPSFQAQPRMGQPIPSRGAQPPANDNSVRRPTAEGYTPRPGSPDRSHVGRLNQLDERQFQVYMDARSRGMTPEQAMVAARGE